MAHEQHPLVFSSSRLHLSFPRFLISDFTYLSGLFYMIGWQRSDATVPAQEKETGVVRSLLSEEPRELEWIEGWVE